jgi:hypothetical protein
MYHVASSSIKKIYRIDFSLNCSFESDISCQSSKSRSEYHDQRCISACTLIPHDTHTCAAGVLFMTYVHPQEKGEETTNATNPNPNEKVKIEMNRSNRTTQ